MNDQEWQHQIRQAKDRKALKRIADKMMREQYREVDDALKRWHAAPPPPVPDPEPEYKP